MTLSTEQRMTLEEYLTYDDGTDTRYELADGVLVPMGTENPINPQITGFLFAIFLNLGIPHYRLVIGHQLEVRSLYATARQPDLIVHSEASEAAITQDGKLLRCDRPAPLLVIEVVSSSDTEKRSRDRDYQEKRLEYETRGIPEYWIIDPMVAVVTILTLKGATYQEQQFTQHQRLNSLLFPDLNLTAEQVLRAGK